jgi:ParB-like chromosome segregation protein Spo0J
MKMDQVGLLDETFTHIGEDAARTQTTYAVTALRKRIIEGGPGIVKTRVPVEQEHADYCVMRRGVEQERLERLLLSPDALAAPIIFIASPDGSHLLVDGTHRYVCFFGLGLPQILAYVVDAAVAADYIIEDIPQMPEDVVMAPSGLAMLRDAFGLEQES